MDARRTVGSAGRRGDREAVAAARRRVHDAKLALGERGDPWWDPPTEPGRVQRIDAALRTLARHRGPTSSICPSDAARVVGGSTWRASMDAVRERMRALATAGELEVLQRGRPVDPGGDWRGPLRARAVPDGAPG
jgi:hypothetical protein